MDKISNLVHTTMLEFLATLNENSLDGIFTARLTPCKFENNYVEKQYQTEHYTYQLQKWLHALCDETCCGCDNDEGEGGGGELCNCPDPDPNIKKVLCFREYGDKVGVHFHLRFVTTYKTRKSIADKIKTHFPIPKGTGNGNAAYSVRDCKAKDKTIWKNASYIAKGCDCVFKWGYTSQEVEWFCVHASKYQKMEGKPKWQQILIWNLPELQYSLAENCFTEVLVETIVNWHKLKNKEIPQQYQFGKIMHNISFKLNHKYRSGMLNTLTNIYRKKNAEWSFGDDELPDWGNQGSKDLNLKISHLNI